MDPELWPRSGIIVPDLDPARYEKQINKNVIFLCILDCVYCIEFKVFFFNFISKYRVYK